MTQTETAPTEADHRAFTKADFDGPSDELRERIFHQDIDPKVVELLPKDNGARILDVGVRSTRAAKIITCSTSIRFRFRSYFFTSSIPAERMIERTMNRFRRSAWLPMVPLYPIMAIMLRRKSLKKRYADMHDIYRRHLKWVLSPANLMGRITIAVGTRVRRSVRIVGVGGLRRFRKRHTP